MGVGQSIAGRKKNTPTDLYQTPPHATEALLSAETFEGEIWEPCSGYGAISKVLEGRGYEVYSSDILDDAYGDGGIDFLSTENCRHVPNIVTNPPYRDALPFLKQALRYSDHKVAFLLKLTFLESRKRKSFFEASPPSRVWVFSERITMWPFGEEEPKNGGTIAYAWFVWDKLSEEEARLGWL